MESYGLQVALGITEENMNKNVGLVPCAECAKHGVKWQGKIRCMGEEREVNYSRKEKGKSCFTNCGLVAIYQQE